MDLLEIFSSESQQFIKENSNSAPETILLKAKNFPSLNVPVLVAQIEGKNTAKRKLPSWYAFEKIIYPTKLSMEQCSSEIAANYKSSLTSGKTIIDLTGGFGVDCVAFSNKFKNVIYVERNKELSEIAKHNFNIIGKNNIEIHNEDSETFVLNIAEKVDWIYIDPARRKEGGKVFKFTDCEPNIIKFMDLLVEKSNHILIKTSPILDIDHAIKELKYVQEIHVLSIENECKELLFSLSKNIYHHELKIITINIDKNKDVEKFEFTRKQESDTKINFSYPQEYLYEPNTSILKAGAFKSIANTLGVTKLHTNSHLYTSENLLENFPGRTFKIIKPVKYSKKEIQAEIPDGKANITVRNFPYSVEEIRKKTGLKDGGNYYLFATTDISNKLVILVTQKVK